jgi:hypothetical protein
LSRWKRSSEQQRYRKIRLVFIIGGLGDSEPSSIVAHAISSSFSTFALGPALGMSDDVIRESLCLSNKV